MRPSVRFTSRISFSPRPPLPQRLAKRLTDNPELEVLIVSPETHHSWLEAQSMRAGRARFSGIVKAAGGERVWLAHPQVTDGGTRLSTMVHSKVMIVDDTLLRIGSANLNNRSMGTDTECDLAVIADKCRATRNDRALAQSSDRRPLRRQPRIKSRLRWKAARAR